MMETDTIGAIALVVMVAALFIAAYGQRRLP
jgi:hypothetical protein